MIYGLTHNDNGEPIESQTVSRKVSIGLPVDSTRTHPEKIDHFMVTEKNANGDWIEDREIMKILGDKPREVKIYLLHDEPDDIFRTEYAWWGKSECKCRGDGKNANRSLAACPPEWQEKHKGLRRVKWAGCGRSCPDLQDKKCKPSGSLYFALLAGPAVGSVCAYYTSSHETIKRIYSSLLLFRRLFQRIRGVEMLMVLRPGKTRYVDKKGKRHTSQAFFVNLEIRGELVKIIQKAVSEGSSFMNMLPSADMKQLPNEVVYLEAGEEAPPIEPLTEEEQARVMTGEFYPEQSEEIDTETGELSDDLKPFDDFIDKWGIANAQKDLILSFYQFDINEIVSFITSVDEMATELEWDNEMMIKVLVAYATTPTKMLKRMETSIKEKEKKPVPESQEQASLDLTGDETPEPTPVEESLEPPPQELPPIDDEDGWAF